MKQRVNGIDLNYAIDGPDGAPWVTFTTGIANDVAMWDAHVDVLARDYRLLRYDSRGHGGSDATAPPYDFDMLIGDTVGLWDALGIEQSVLVGIGLGGMTAMATALRHPNRISALVPAACRARLTPDYEAIWPPMIETASEHGIEPIVERTAERWFPEEFRAANPDVMDRVRAMIRRSSRNGYLGCIAALLTLDLGDEIAAITAPTLFVSGALDFIGGPADMMQSMAEQVPGARHVTLDGAGHICSMGNAEGFSRALSEFLGSL
jgi:3-oxoadipate enol-lactonase